MESVAEEATLFSLGRILRKVDHRDMKTATLLLIVSISGLSMVVAPGCSVVTLRERFAHSEEVNSSIASGLLARTVFWVAGENEFTRALTDAKKYMGHHHPNSCL